MNFKKTAIAVCAVCVALPMFARHRHHGGGLYLAGGILNAAAATANIVNSSIYGPRTVYVNPPVVASPVVTAPVVATPVVETYYSTYPCTSTYWYGGYYGGCRSRFLPPPPPPRPHFGGFRGGFRGGHHGGFRGGHHGGFRGGRHRR